MNGPEIVTDIVDVYVFRGDERLGYQLLQLRRVKEPFAGSWQPVMGRIDRHERAEHAALRELQEETGLSWTAEAFLGLWLLDQVHPYFMASRNVIVMSPRFACQVKGSWKPVLDQEHDDARWVRLDSIDETFMWPGQRASIRDLQASVLTPGFARDALRVDPGSL